MGTHSRRPVIAASAASAGRAPDRVVPEHPEYLDRLAQRARPYLAYIVREVEKKGLPAEFALLPVVESAFRVYAYSRKGASGCGSSCRRPDDCTD